MVDSAAVMPIIDGMAKKVFLTVDEVVARLGFNNRQAVYDAIKRGQLEGFRDDRRMLWVSEESVNNYVKPKRGRPTKNS